MNPLYPGMAPSLLKLLANDVRWQILAVLAHGDLRVQEVAASVGKPINLVSYHLKLLREQDLVHERRSSADGRDIYYTLDVGQLDRLYRRTGAQLHPGVAAWQPAPEEPGRLRPLRVLFVCTENRARSQMAEGILRHLGGPQVTVQSAGIRPGEVHPLAVQALGDLGIDITAQRSKHLDSVADQVFDRVITVCDQARERCPSLPGSPQSIHWSIEDPIAAATRLVAEDARRALFAATARELLTRIRFFLLAEF